jgi:hypothetical protein
VTLFQALPQRLAEFHRLSGQIPIHRLPLNALHPSGKKEEKEKHVTQKEEKEINRNR